MDALPNHPARPEAPADLFHKRRERFLERIGEGVAILPATPELFRSRDTAVHYRQDSDLYYLTGFPEPSAVAVLTSHDADHRFTLFVHPRDPEREAWNGPRAGVEGACDRFGANAAYPIDELDDHLNSLVEPADRILYALGSDSAMDERVADLLAHFRRARQRAGRGPDAVEDPGTLLAEMRLIKEPYEVECVRVAAAAGVAGHRAAMRAARPGAGEWEIEAALEAAFRHSGATGPAFPSIVGSGPNATILHYVNNDRQTRDGDLVLIDAGAEVGMYCSDITRTFPVSGRFSPEQRIVYDIVLAAQEAAIDAIRPGAPVSDLHDAALRVLVSGMIDLGLLTGTIDALIEEEAYKRFYMHRTSHWLGLDVHDVGMYERGDEPVVLQPGMVLTVEPGIYISENTEEVPEALRGIGIRIEDDVLVTDSGHEILTRGVPVAAGEIEALMEGAER